MSTQPPPEDDFESHRAVPAKGTEVDRPDWLVGPDEGATSEVQRAGEQPSKGAPRLVRPGLPESEGEPRKAKPAKPVAWTAAASSVPTLRHRGEASPQESRPGPDPPPAAPAEAWPGGPVTTSGSAVALPAGTQPAEPPADALPGDDFPMDDLPAGTGTDGGAARPATGIAPLKEPWWAIALDAFRSNRLLQAVIALGAVGFLVWKMWPSPVPSLPIAKIQANPEGFDGRVVELHGQVGDVFPIGGGYAFYLHQGSDTIVVFTRSRVPTRRAKVSVLGSVSTGYLDGVARPALFEETTP
jgi:hypothetical protein